MYQSVTIWTRFCGNRARVAGYVRCVQCYLSPEVPEKTHPGEASTKEGADYLSKNSQARSRPVGPLSRSTSTMIRVSEDDERFLICGTVRF